MTYHTDSSDDEMQPLTQKGLNLIWNDDIKKKALDSDTESEGNSNSAAEQKSLLKSSSIRQKLLLLDLVFTDFLLYFGVSAANPFFSRVAVAKGGTVFNSAVILQSVMLSLTIFSVVFGKLQPKIGSKNLFMLGVALFGLCQFAFGFLEYVEDITVFIIIGVTLRVLAGAGIAAYMVSSLTIAFQEYPNHVSKIVGVYEAAVGTAYLMGPLFGGVLYDISGMCLPFAVSGGMVLLSLPLHYAVIKVKEIEVRSSSNEEFALFKFLFKPSVALCLISYGSVMGICGYYNVGFTTYVEKSGFSTSHAGFAMFGSGLGYGVLSPVVGYVVSLRRWLPTVSIIIGDIAYGASLLLFAPNQSKPLIYLACFCLGTTSAVASIPTLERLIYLANDNRPPSAEFNAQIYSGVSGITFAALGLGYALFPMISSWVQGIIGSFSEEMFTLAILQFVIAFMILLLCVINRSLN